MSVCKQRWKWLSGASLVAIVTVMTAVSGCEKKEKVMEIQTPGFNLEVNKTTSPTGEKSVEMQTNRGDKIEIDATNKKSD